ncbi:hypothetical protein AN639_03390 [Candidatus Epulonipiscium fishelsonii]|nr:hypothetical protein AN639_03390 [Epulopiscium sp. SCG-B05WGA-EpuloA1]
MNNEIIREAILSQQQIFVERLNKDIELFGNEQNNEEIINKLIFIEYFTNTIEDCLETNNYRLAMKRLTLLTALMDKNKNFQTCLH